MKHHYYPAAVLLAGVLSAQILFSVLVYLSDVSLYQNLAAIKNSGYMIVPNELVMPHLLKIKPAFCGGLFFSLTTGAGLTLVTLLTAALWRRYSGRKWLLTCLYLSAAIFFTFKLNFNLPVILVFILTMGVAGLFTILFYPVSGEKNKKPFVTMIGGHLLVIVLIGLTWMPVINKDVFISIRDNLLLSNPVGEKINHFYYKYTLYPAETFKSLDQKLLKSCRIEIEDRNLYQQVRRQMVAQDYLPVNENFHADLTVANDNDTLIFSRDGKQVHDCLIKEFKRAPHKNLELVSEKTDPNSFFRRFTFLSLIAASPLLCFLFLHVFFMSGLFFVKSITIRFAGASLSCLLIFAISAIFFYHQSPETLEIKDINRYLKSNQWQDRVNALKAISDRNLRIEQFIEPGLLVQSPLTVERYWLAKTLGSSRNPESYNMILRLLDDPQPNIVCMAMYSLGKQNRFKATDEIIRRIKSSGHWYVQWYAYKALKRLGWTQEK